MKRLSVSAFWTHPRDFRVWFLRFVDNIYASRVLFPSIFSLHCEFGAKHSIALWAPQSFCCFPQISAAVITKLHLCSRISFARILPITSVFLLLLLFVYTLCHLILAKHRVESRWGYPSTDLFCISALRANANVEPSFQATRSSSCQA